MDRFKGSRLAVAGTALAVGLLVGACGSDNGGTAQPTSTVGSTVFQTIATTAPSTTTPATTAPAGGTTGSTAPGTASEPGMYTVVYGDALPLIAKKLGVKYEDLLAVNGIEPMHFLRPGDKLKIPGASTTGSSTATTAAPGNQGTGTATTATTAAGTSGTYTVQPGDALGYIAAKLGVDLDEFLALNGFSSATDLIAPGQKLKIPPKN